MDSIEQLLAQMKGKDHTRAYQCLKLLEEESGNSDAVSPYLDLFIELMDSPNSYLRARGLRLIAANARWDSEGKVDQIIDRYLTHILDEKPTTARQCIQALPLIARARPGLTSRIREALSSADLSGYADSMEPLLRKDIEAALKQIS